MSNTFFSQATNFQSSAAGSVDPRTGLFNYMMPVAHLIGNHRLGPEQIFTLTYSPLNGENQGLGIGFSLGLTKYDAKKRLLVLSTGEQYKVIETDEYVSLKQYKQDVIRFEKDAKQNVYRVIHKSGLIEILTGPQNTYNVKVPIKIVNPLGYSLKLDWSYRTEAVPRLETISDEKQTKKLLLKIHYETSRYTQITVWPESSESYDIRLIFNNDKTTRICNETSDQTLGWTLEYDSDTGFLSRISSPTGFTEFVEYDSDGHLFPEEARLSPLPYVTRYTQRTKQHPDIVREYEYTESNFLGYGSNESWDKDDDYLYGVMRTYHYGSTERWNNGHEKRSITRRYNNYHLLVSENVQQHGCQRQHETEYYAKVGQTFEEQDAYFQLPRSATVRFISDRGQREEITQTEFDDAGNPTRQTAPDGTLTVWKYYHAKDEDEKEEDGHCPVDPHGFVRYVKSKTVTPPRVNGYDDVPVHQVRYRYDPLSTRPGSQSDYAVVCTRQEIYSNSQLLHTRQTQYVDNVASPHHGRLASITETVHNGSDTHPTATTSHWTSQKTFTYTLEEGKLQTTAKWRGHDGVTTIGTQVKSCVSGKVLHETDPQGCTVHFDYDSIGRLLKQVNNAGTRFARTVMLYTYHIEPSGTTTTTQQDVWGNQSQIRFDGQGKPYQRKIREKNQDWHPVSDIEYDGWGRLMAQNDHDWLPINPDQEQAELVSSQQQITYDDWGQRCLVTDGTGKRVRQDYDPISLTVRNTMEADGLHFGYSETVYNLQHQPLTLTQYGSQGNPLSQQHYQYDGLGRLRSTVDELEQKTEYTYDVFNRISAVRHSDGTVIRKRYAPFNTDSLLTHIEVDGKVLGQREFDSLGRIIKTSVGSRSHYASYKGSLPVPETITNALGQTIHYQHDPQQGYALTQVKSADIKQHFTYDANTGAMSQAVSAQQMSHAFKYTPAGQLQQEAVHFDDTGTARHTEYTYSPAGKPTAYRDVTGQLHRLRFDKHGRPVETADDMISVTCRYDAASRMNSWTVHDKANNQQLTTTLTWDDFGRETERRIETGAEVLTLEQTYTITNQLASRITRSQQGGLLCQENYTYDVARRWLTEYQCTGTECPQDAYGMTLTRQQFTYDKLGNILTCVTTLLDGSNDTAIFSYHPSDPCQLQQITHTHPGYPPVITLVYDKAGRLIRDEAGRELTYDSLGRLTLVTQGEHTNRYGYDVAGRLALQQLGNEQTHELYYQGTLRVAEIVRESGDEIRLVQANGAAAAALTGQGAYLLGTDGQGNVLMSQQKANPLARYRYTPYGQQAAESRNPALPAYVGERSDPVGGSYHLGNGYRSYNPVLMRFTAPDSLSPFGAGGLNPYAYCLGDPINRHDPSGHISVGSILGIVFGTIGMIIGLAAAIPTGGASLSIGAAIVAGVGFLGDATGIASAATEESNPQASAILNWVSLGLGAVSLGSALLGGLARGMRKTGEQLERSFSSGLSGRGGMIAGGSEAYATGSRALRETRYVHSFREIRNLAGRDIVENLGSHQVSNIEVNLTTLGNAVPAERYSSVYGDFLKLGFWESSPGNNLWKIDNSTPISILTGQSTHVNITNDIYLKLYGQFVTEHSPVTHVTMINSLRSAIDFQVASGVHFDINTMTKMQQLWGYTGYSGTFKDWLTTEMTLRFSTREQDIQQLSNMIIIQEPNSLSIMYNQFF
ncbi:hypothetical protein ID855_02490 [Xenorhabdus sp. ZM]|uniref:RHS repeat-associated core domain-containing protein n=1 Tax=Xenorhabdus szentirmaii TaxID=290112 RepID=UPI00199FDAF8|nr:RHS repeat-associated core domain-containing protein [Xenorhabdus sp. ZM]MBD2803598.1 hypothetical protein [Xenorhabdus sp. ZM]